MKVYWIWLVSPNDGSTGVAISPSALKKFKKIYFKCLHFGQTGLRPRTFSKSTLFAHLWRLFDVRYVFEKRFFPFFSVYSVRISPCPVVVAAAVCTRWPSIAAPGQNERSTALKTKDFFSFFIVFTSSTSHMPYSTHNSRIATLNRGLGTVATHRRGHIGSSRFVNDENMFMGFTTYFLYSKPILFSRNRVRDDFKSFRFVWLSVIAPLDRNTHQCVF